MGLATRPLASLSEGRRQILPRGPRRGHALSL
jgi:hypothetical protein